MLWWIQIPKHFFIERKCRNFLWTCVDVQRSTTLCFSYPQPHSIGHIQVTHLFEAYLYVRAVLPQFIFPAQDCRWVFGFWLISIPPLLQKQNTVFIPVHQSFPGTILTSHITLTLIPALHEAWLTKQMWVQLGILWHRILFHLIFNWIIRWLSNVTLCPCFYLTPIFIFHFEVSLSCCHTHFLTWSSHSVAEFLLQIISASTIALKPFPSTNIWQISSPVSYCIRNHT